MKHELTDVSATQKHLAIEIPSDAVDREIASVTREYGRTARVHGFRPGKVPPKVVWQRFREQILHEVVHKLVPHAVDEALHQRGLDPVDTPDIRDVVIEEGQPRLRRVRAAAARRDGHRRGRRAGDRAAAGSGGALRAGRGPRRGRRRHGAGRSRAEAG
jgi:FKBP-type peptidyl-prolyl cis-trans isomerase (trigger factor)